MTLRKKGEKPSLKTLLPKRKKERRRVELLGGISTALMLLLIVGAFSLSGLQQWALRSPNVAAVISAILAELANADRTEYGLDTLRVSPVLVAVAQAKANDMASKGYFAHTSPEGIDPWHWFESEGYAYKAAGENLAIDFSDSGDVERAWMNSPTHRDNILNDRYTEIGIATAQGMYQGHMTTFVVQEFATPLRDSSPIAMAEQVPEEPTELATASSEDTQVLGSSNEIEPHVAAALAEEMSDEAPVWGYAVSFPRDMLRYVYYAVGVFILLALAFETRLEFKTHHRKKAIRAALLLTVMIGLFFFADYAFFVEPVLAAAL